MGGVLLCASFKCHALLERVQMLNDSMETFCSHSNICLSRRAHAKVRASFEAAGLKGCQDARLPGYPARSLSSKEGAGTQAVGQ